MKISEFGVVVTCGAHDDGGRALLAPISPGLFRTVHVLEVRRIAFGEPVTVAGPGVLAFDGDRERALAPGQRATLTVARDGPRRIDVEVVLARAAREGALVGRAHWHDAFDESFGGADCC